LVNEVDAFFSIIYSILVVIVVFFLAWFVTRLVASKSSFAGHGKNISVIEKMAVSKESFIMLVKAFDNYLLVGVTAQGMTVLKEIDAESIDTELLIVKKESFAEILKSTIDQTLPNGKIKDKVNNFLDKSKFLNKDKPSSNNENFAEDEHNVKDKFFIKNGGNRDEKK
jgi:flagellar biosynthetic protein FliO